MIDVQKECNVHGISSFVKRKDGRYRCRKCSVDAVTKRRKKVKQMAVEYKGGCCVKCGYNKSLSALEFHHLDPSEKDFGLSHKGNTLAWETIVLELDKCILLCANCHREVHDDC